jgi:two-component sensor histidine kinase
MTLMARLYLLVLLAVAPAAALLSYGHWDEHRRRAVEAEAEALRYAHLLSGELDRIVEGIRGQLNSVAEAPVVQDFRDPECGQYLQRLESHNPATTSVSVYDLNGDRRCSAVDRVNILDRAYFREALRTDGLVTGEYAVGKTSGLPILPFAQRIKSDGRVVGVIVTTLRLDWLRRHLAGRGAAFPPHSSITVVDRSATILVRVPNREREGTKLARYPQLLTAPSGGATLRSQAENTADGVARLLGYTSLQDPPVGLVVAVGLPVDSVFAGLAEERRRDLLLLGGAALLTVLAAHVVGRAFVLRPVSALLAVAERLRRGDLAARVEVVGPGSELGRLGGTFNAMAAELERALSHKDVLLRELSHRVMNSLHTIAALSTMQARSIRDPDARRQVDQAVTRIRSVAMAYRRLHAPEGVEVIEFSLLLHELCSDLQASMLPEGSPIAVDADPLLLAPEQAMPLALVVNELVTNAVKHGGDEPAVTVKLGRSSEGARLAVRNRGTLPAGYDPVTTNGFGMRMVRSTVAQLGGRLEAASMAGETEFSITFKPALAQPPALAVVEGGGGVSARG